MEIIESSSWTIALGKTLLHSLWIGFLLLSLQTILETLLFYHPAVWYISRMIRKEREHCCDDLVLGRTDQPSTYARALLGLAEMGRPAANLFPRSDGADTDQLYKRILRILNQQHMKTKLREKIGALVLLAGCMIMVLMISGFTPERQIIPGGISSDTIPDANEQEAEEMEKAMKEIDWEAMKLEITQARKEALEDIDWKKIREEISTARMQIDSAMQELELEYDFDFDMDFDFETEEIRIDMEKALKELEEIKKQVEGGHQ